MTDEEFLEDRRSALHESVEYFSAEHKPEREQWVCIEFLTNLGLAFNEDEVLSSKEDPPDVLFRDAAFEIKEILDPGRKRHDEFKKSYQKALEATKPEDLLTEYTPIDITPDQISILILKELERLQYRYAPAVKSNLDLLFYVNLTDNLLKEGAMPSAQQFDTFEWRSISAIFGWGGLIFFANAISPDFIYSRVGTLTQKKFE
ncbi:MAG: DUF1780 domain-containing protein [Cycloclasticus sp.]